MTIGTYISIITLNVNRLNDPPKRPRLTEWYKKKTHIYAVYKKPTSDLKTHIDRKWEDGKLFHANRKQKKARVAILMSDKIDLKIRNTAKNKNTT